MVEDRYDTRHNPRAASDHTKNTHTSRPQSHHRFEKKEVGQDAKGHCVPDLQGAKVRTGDCQRGDRLDSRYACFVSTRDTFLLRF